MGSKVTAVVWILTFVCAAVAMACIAGEFFGWHLVPDRSSHLMDTGPVTRAILTLFAIGLVLNAWNTAYVGRQMLAVSRGLGTKRCGTRDRLVGHGLLGVHIARLYEMADGPSASDVSQSASLGCIRNQLHRREWLVRSASGMLLTLGLIGTVVGLTDRLGGLSSTVNAVALETLERTERRR